jgi:glycosyltransferase involved in cell wall biosynthesis
LAIRSNDDGVNTAPSVTVITGTTGSRHLHDCLKSVQDQSYPHVEHMVVIDGPKFSAAATTIIESAGNSRPIRTVQLPYNTGRDRFNGHRIYGAMPFLCNSNFVAYLDEDNWFNPNHIESLISLIVDHELLWAYALRNVVDQSGSIITTGDCESLGRWAAWDAANPDHPGAHLIDVSCYMISRHLATRFSWVWNRRTRQPGVNEVDRELCRRLMKFAARFETTGQHTVNYRVGSTELSVNENYFLRGNRIMANRYPDGLPWQAPVV